MDLQHHNREENQQNVGVIYYKLLYLCLNSYPHYHPHPSYTHHINMETCAHAHAHIRAHVPKVFMHYLNNKQIKRLLQPTSRTAKRHIHQPQFSTLIPLNLYHPTQIKLPSQLAQNMCVRVVGTYMALCIAPNIYCTHFLNK